MRVVQRSLFVVVVAGALLGVVPARAAVPTTWTVPVDLDRPNEVGGGAKVGIDGAGNALAIWLASTGTSASILRSATRPAGGDWSAPTDRTDRVEFSDPLALAEDATGRAVVAWSQWNGTHFTVHVVTVSPDGTWTSPLELSPPDESANFVQAAIDEVGHAVVAWNSDAGVESATYLFGGGWSPVDTLTSDAQASAVQVSTDAAGNADAVLQLQVDHEVQAAHRAVGGAWGAGVTISNPGVDAAAPFVASGPGGTATATWSEASSVVSADRSTTGTWSAPAALTDGGSGVPAELLRTSPTGNTVVVVVAVIPGVGISARAAWRDAGGPWSQFVDLVSPDANLFDVALTMNSLGDALVAASPRKDDGTSRTVVQTLPSGGEWSAPLLVSGESVFTRDAAVALDDNGNAVVSWSTGGTEPGHAQAVTSPAPVAPPAPPLVRLPAFTG